MEDYIGTILIIVGVYIFTKITKKIVKIVISLLIIFGIAMTLYGEQITAFIMKLLQKG